MLTPPKAPRSLLNFGPAPGGGQFAASWALAACSRALRLQRERNYVTNRRAEAIVVRSTPTHWVAKLNN